MMESSLMLVLMVLFVLANYGFPQTCDLFDERTEQCFSLPTSTLCGVPSITVEQMRQARAAASTIRMIEEMGGPIVEGSPEALELGISVENPIIKLTSTQGNFYRRCAHSNLLTPSPGNFSDQDESFSRKKRQSSSRPAACCSPSPETVRVVASVDQNGRAVEVIQSSGSPGPMLQQLNLIFPCSQCGESQPSGLAQNFPSTTNCRATTCSGAITCGPVRTLVPAEVAFLQPPALGRINIVVDICGAVTTETNG